MKLIKFDLPINGTKIRTLEELRDNFTTEILELHASGVLSKWLKSRGLMSEADKSDAIVADQNDVDRLVVLSEILGMDADRAVIEAALSESSGRQGVGLHADHEELKYKEKFEQLSKLMDELKRKKLYLTQDDYNRFVKDKIQIENEKKVESVVWCEEVYEGCNSSQHAEFSIVLKFSDFVRFDPVKQVGNIVEAGDVISNIVATEYHYATHNGALIGSVKSPLRGMLVEMGELPKNHSNYRIGDPMCYIRVDHDTASTIKIIPD